MCNKRIISFLAVLFAVYFHAGGHLYAKELQVGPPSYHWRGVEPGKVIEMPVSILIRNRSQKERVYRLRARTPEELNLTPDEGFGPLADTGWVSFGEVLVKIPAGETRRVKIFITIPGKAKFKKPCMFYVEVKEDVSRFGYLQGKPDMFALACYPKIYLWPKER